MASPADGEARNVKVLVIGDRNVGKSSIIHRFIDGTYAPGALVSTLGVDFNSRMVSFDGQSMNLQVWDTSGQDVGRAVTRNVYRGAQAVIVVYDITNRASFESARVWLSEFQGSEPSPSVGLVLVGNKADCASSREVERGDGVSLAHEKGMNFIETSAALNDGVEEAFKWAVLSHMELARPSAALVATNPPRATPVAASNGTRVTLQPAESPRRKKRFC